MKIRFFCPRWGAENLDYETFFQKVKDAGYDGVEMSLPADIQQKNQILKLLSQSGLDFIAQHWETLTADFEMHKKEYRERLINLATAKPLFINTQTGKDFFSYKQNHELIQIADEIAENYGVKIIHETHRGKFSFALHILAEFLAKIPDLRISLDISHWINVAESWLDNQQDSLDLALSRTEHMHARVGFPEGPQIPDPRVPEWQEALQRHVSVWQKVIDKRREDGREEITITTEFGPYPYMTILPSNKLPIANQWDVNVFIMQHLKQVLE
jgi:sugar phosphate isomerase/epimerase